MGEIRVCAVPDVRFDLAPGTLVIADSLAPGANRQQTLECFYIFQSLSQLRGNPPQFQQRHDLLRQSSHGLLLLGINFVRLAIDRAQSSQRQALPGHKRETRIEPDIRFFRHERAVGETGILQSVTDDERLQAQYGVRAKGHVP